MKILNFPAFGTTPGGVSLPGGYRAFGIHSGSEVDVCRVGSNLLGVGQLVPAAGNATPVRGFRTGNLDTGTGGAEEGGPPEAIGQNLILVGYEHGDELVGPGCRAPAMVDGFIAGDALGVDAGHANLLLRLPFSGRKEAAFYVRVDSDTTDLNHLNVLVRGVRYLSPMLCSKFPNSPPFFDEVTDTFVAAFGQVNVNAPGSELMGLTMYVTGSGDLVEYYDELELWVWGDAQADNIIAMGEASGERNL